MKNFFADKLNLRLDPQKTIILLVFAVNLFLVFNFFFPSMRDINVFDESVYVTTGKSLVEGQLPSFARSPLIAVLYALVYLPYAHSPLWLIQSVALGRIILFALMWLGSYLIATQLAKWFPPLTMAGFLLVFPVTLEILLNPSDSLFAAMSGFAFWQLLCFYNSRGSRHLWLGSLFAGLSALSRNDGLILFAIFVLLAVVIIGRTRWTWAWLAAIFVPFLVLVGGYVLLYGARTGNFSLGTQERSYTAFEQGQTRVYEEDPNCKQKTLRCAVLQVEELYGTAAENHNSVLNAIMRNPQAYFSRLPKQFRTLPDMVYLMFGARLVFLFLILFGRGLLELVRRKQWLLTVVLLAWPLFLGVYFLTFFRVGYLRMPYYVVYVIAAVGAAAFVADALNRKAVLIWAALLVILTIGAMAADVRGLYFASGLLLAALGLIYFVSRNWSGQSSLLAGGLLLLLCMGLIMRPTLDPPSRRDLTAGEEEQALLTITRYLPPRSLVAAGAPGWVSAARMDLQSINGDEIASLSSGREIYEYFKSRGVRAVYVDSTLSNGNENLWRLMESDLGQWYETVYSGRAGSIRVLLLK